MLAPSNHKAPRSESRDGLREVLSDDLGILGLIAAARVGKLLSLAAFALALAPPLSSGAAEGGPLRPVRIMPLGDSITEGTSGDATWRYWLQKSLEANGCVVDFVGSRRGVRYGQARFSDFDPDHEGHWGWTTAQVKAEIDRWASDAKPEIVLLHLGTNDLGSDPERTSAGLGAVVASLRRANPAVEIYLARLIPAAGVPDEVMRRTNDAIARLAAERDRPESRLIVVDQFTGFDPRADTYDGVHPNEWGERKMARRWFGALRGRLDCLRSAEELYRPTAYRILYRTQPRYVLSESAESWKSPPQPSLLGSVADARRRARGWDRRQ
jgi:lysophospholipase L1-like esterase